MRAIMALSWELLYPQRWLLSCTALALVGAAGFTFLSDLDTSALGAALSVGVIVPLVVSLGLLSHGAQGRLETTESGFPRRLFTLPVSTAALVGPPVFLSTVVLLVSWLVFAGLVLKPLQVDVPLLWPGLYAAAVLACLQALVWSPMPLPLLRLGLFILVVPGLTVVGGAAHLSLGEGVLVALSVLLWLGGVAGSWWGVHLARRGIGQVEPVTVGPVAVAGALNDVCQSLQPFASPRHAQVWLERRFNFWTWLFLTGFYLALSVPSLVMFDAAVGNDLPHAFPWLSGPAEVVGRSWLVVGLVLLFPLPLWASLAGVDLGRLTDDTRTFAMPAYFATLPITVAEMTRAKLIVAFGGVGRLWGITILVILVWAVVMGRVGEMVRRAVELAGSPAAAAGMFVGGLALLVAFTWLVTIANLWAAASGRKWLAFSPAIAFAPAWLAVVAIINNWRASHWPVLGGAVVVALLAKAVAVVWAANSVRQENLISASTLSIALTGWALLTGALVAVAWRLTGGSLLAVGSVVLLTPLAGCLIAPLALARNRTR